MSGEWYYQLMGETTGPITQAKLIAVAAEGRLDRETLVRKGKDGSWKMAVEVGGLFSKADEVRTSQQDAQRQADLYEKTRWENMTVSTSAPPAKYDFKIIDTVFALDSDGRAGVLFGKTGDASAAFAKVKERLKVRAYELGADGVINCQFEYRVAVTGEGLASQQVLEIFAYGTAVKFV